MLSTCYLPLNNATIMMKTSECIVQSPEIAMKLYQLISVAFGMLMVVKISEDMEKVSLAVFRLCQNLVVSTNVLDQTGLESGWVRGPKVRVEVDTSGKIYFICPIALSLIHI